MLACSVLLLAGPARAAFVAVTFNANQIGMPLTVTGPQTGTGGAMSNYINWAANCANVYPEDPGRTPCQNSDRPPLAGSTTQLFSWGTRQGNNQTDPTGNSFIQIQYTGSDPIELGGVRIASDEAGLGPAAGPRYPSIDPVQFAEDARTGTGAMVIYEWTDSTNTAPLIGPANVHQAEEQRFEVARASSARPDRPGAVILTTGGANNLPVLPITGGYVETGDDGINRIRDASFNTEYKFLTPITLQPNELLFVRFFEAVWNNQSFITDSGNPDAYYGYMNITLLEPQSDTPAITVTAETTTGPAPAGSTLPLFARAGSGQSATATLSVTNTGDAGSTLVTEFGDFAGIPYTDGGGGLTATPASGQGAQNLTFADGSGDPSMDRTFTVAPATGLAWNTGPNLNGTHGINVGSSVQSITHDDPDQTTPIEIAVTGTTVGPVLGLTTGTDIPLEIAARTPYGDAINIGTLEVGDDYVQRELLLANVFGERVGDLTTLTVFNIGIDGNHSSYFCFVLTDGTCNSGNAYPIDLDGQRFQANDPTADNDTLSLTIRFLRPDPASLSQYTANLFFLTDMNRSFGLNDGDSATRIAFTLTGEFRPAPIPATAFLLGAGLVGLLVVRRPHRAGLWNARLRGSGATR